ncbi:hypothetical protein C446_15273 [Halobiforma nitratireducens JCM 10879]|uniref:Uncharacterized protein n=2 Tax=Halobiforma nitratireducens TaxID=130048 RepID=M0LDQ0_9EURY|nr:hypothetical protein C446_15273 [Halobiforma nitratireducens JCM 10879]
MTPRGVDRPATAAEVGTVLSLVAKASAMRERFDSDVGFYVAVGAFTIAVFVVALIILAVLAPAGIGARELGGLVVGFLLFMLVYFVSVTVHQLEEREEV